jgi:hypothetical protein
VCELALPAATEVALAGRAIDAMLTAVTTFDGQHVAAAAPVRLG